MTHDRSSLWVLPLFGLAVVAPFSIGAGSVATALILAAALLRLLVDREHAGSPPAPVLWSLGVFVGITALATLLSAPFPMRWDKWAEETWIKLLLIAVPVLCAGAPQWSRRVVQVTLVAGGLVACYAVWQHFGGVELVSGRKMIPIGSTFISMGFFGHHLSYGGQVLVLWVFAAAWVLGGGFAHRGATIGALAVFVLLSLGLMWSFARSAQLGAMAGAIALILQQRGRRRRLSLVVLISMVVLALAMPSMRMRFGRFLETGAETTRVHLWQSAMAGIAARPWLGFGPGNFGHLMSAYEVPGDYDTRAHAHNDFIMDACNAGLLGLLAALALLFSVGFTLARSRSRAPKSEWLLAAGVAVQVAISVAGMFQVYQTDDEVEMVLYLLLGCGLSAAVWRVAQGTANPPAPARGAT